MTTQEGVVITGVGLEPPDVESLVADLGVVSKGETLKERIGRKGHRYKDEATKLALAAARLALDDAGLSTDRRHQPRSESFGVVTSSNLGNLPTVLRGLDQIRADGVDATSPMDLPNASSNNISATLAIWFGLRAINLTVCNGSSSGADAIRLAALAIRAGRAERMLVVGVETTCGVRRRLFREAADSTGLREEQHGQVDLAAALVLESATAARQRRRPAYARVDACTSSMRDTLRDSLAALCESSGPTIDLWLVSPSALADESTSDIARSVRLMRETRIEDPADGIGHTYGAHGVLQAIAACAGLRRRPTCRRVLATCGGILGDRNVTSILYGAPATTRRHQRREQTMDVDLGPTRATVDTETHFGHQLALSHRENPSDELPRPSMLFIHGIGTGPEVWNAASDALQADFDLFYLTLPWDGSQGSKWGRAARPEDWIAAGLDMSQSTPDVVVAHSFGANALLEYLATSPQGVPGAVVLVSPFFKDREGSVEWGVLSHHVNRFLDLLREGVDVNDSDRRLAPDVKMAIAAKVRERVGVYGWNEFLSVLLRTPALDVNRITSPVLVLGGANDIASEWRDCERLADSLSRGQARVSPNAGHFCMAQDTAWFARSVSSFVVDVLATTSSPTK